MLPLSHSKVTRLALAPVSRATSKPMCSSWPWWRPKCPISAAA